jgi:hypothetical protein
MPRDSDSDAAAHEHPAPRDAALITFIVGAPLRDLSRGRTSSGARAFSSTRAS